MKKNIISSSYLSLVLSLLIITLEAILTNEQISIEGLDMRKTYVFVSYFIHLPLFVINLIVTLKVFLFYYKNKFQNTLKYFYLVIPSLIFYVFCLFYLTNGIVKLALGN